MSGPSRDALERLRAQTLELLDRPERLCPAGGRVLAKQKIGGYSARRVVHWVESGEYPTTPIKPLCGVDCCVDCGRPGFDTPTEPEPAPIEDSTPSAPPVPPTVPAVAVERVVEPVAAGALSLRDSGSRSRVVPQPVPEPPAWRAAVWESAKRAVVLVAVFLGVVVSVQGVLLGVESLPGVVDVVEVEFPSGGPFNGE